VLTTLYVIIASGAKPMGLVFALVSLLIGASIGTWLAGKIQITKMPELVAIMHSLIGLAAVFIALAAVLEPNAFGISQHMSESPTLPYGNRLELFLGAVVGAITFSGSVIAFGKLSGTYKFKLFQGTPVVYAHQHLLNLLMGLTILGLGIGFIYTENLSLFIGLVSLALVLGVCMIIPIGGADMPVIVSMLNSYSGWAAAGIGFSLNNSMLIIAGSLVGSSGAILSYIMCKAMNRSFLNVLLGGFGNHSGDASGQQSVARAYKSAGPDDVAFILSNAQKVVIIPGYGLAVSRAQHALKELVDELISMDIVVKYAIHPVAGRMPGHMNVLLAEAEVPYTLVYEMEDINGEFSDVDVVVVLGANDVVNPLALQKGSPIYGMPILEAYKARTIIVNKRSMNPGYAGLDNDLFYMDKTSMLFGDAKSVLEKILKALRH
ncbi:MAG: NAD(P)(+) transhydrogenase (Re/Si-specific) subunit beta, partial [Gammaproteobacteria bacterium]|nr:NAD(P)(+) transhydrogenase (Re/Si-specific) subunit beta [Gammaproteobacteria bacterium]